MSGKTDQLRDLVLKMGASTKVVEQQAKQHGNLRGSSEIERALLGVVSEMIKSYNIQTKISPEQLATVVRLFYKGLSDTEIAEPLGTVPKQDRIRHALSFTLAGVGSKATFDSASSMTWSLKDASLRAGGVSGSSSFPPI
jgi:hypothetical protein